MPENDDEPLFNLDDYVPPGGGLPEHLKGKSAEEIAQHYSNLLKEGEVKVQERKAAPPKKENSQERQPQNRTLTESDVAPAMGTMIQSAKMVAKASLDSDQQKLFDRFLKDISNVMELGFRGVQLADAQNWIFAFNQVLGSKTHILMKESREEAKRTSESSSAPPHEPEKEIELTPLEVELASGLNLGSEGFKSGKKIMNTDAWPLTFSNTKR